MTCTRNRGSAIVFSICFLIFGLLNPLNGQGNADNINDVKRMTPKPIQDEARSVVWKMAYSPKLKLLATVPFLSPARQNSVPVGLIYIWDVATGERKYMLVGHSQLVRYVSFEKTTNHLLSGASDRMIEWDTLTGKSIPNRFFILPKWAHITPSAKELFQFDSDKNVEVRDFETLEKTRTLKASEEANIGTKSTSDMLIAVSADEKMLALGGGLVNRKMQVWDFRTGQLKAIFEHTARRLYHLAFSKDGRYLIGAGSELNKSPLGKGPLGNGILDFWDTKTWKLALNQASPPE